jgi:ABC-2 type transport system permease protein
MRVAGHDVAGDPGGVRAAIGVTGQFSAVDELLSGEENLRLIAKSVETASNTPMFLTLLPFLGSGFILVGTLPTGLQQFARYQPFTPVTETVRGLTGAPIGGNAVAAIAWSLGIATVSFLWAKHLYADRRPG